LGKREGTESNRMGLVFLGHLCSALPQTTVYFNNNNNNNDDDDDDDDDDDKLYLRVSSSSIFNKVANWDT